MELLKLPSKRLLAEVFGKEIYSYGQGIQQFKPIIWISIKDYKTPWFFAPCEIAVFCKQWATNKGYMIFSNNGTKEQQAEAYIIRQYDIEKLNAFWSNTEAEAIFEACEWIKNYK